MSIPEAVKKDAKAQAGSIYNMNAPYAIGYLFTVHKSGKEVAQGMFCDRREEINSDEWDGFLHFTKYGPSFYDLNNERSFNTLRRKLWD